jgi:hypothetical protein
MQTEKQREKLVELLKEADANPYNREITNFEDIMEMIADYLMSNNVVVLPCKAGDIIYIIGEITSQIVYDTINHIMYNGEEFRLATDSGFLVLVEQQLGKTVFLTKPEAEAKLKEMRDGNQSDNLRRKDA